MVACDGVVNGTWEYACEKTTLCFAKVSRLGVSPRFEPRKPMRSARVVSSVIRMTLLGAARLGKEQLAKTTIQKRTYPNDRRKDMTYRQFSIRRRVYNPHQVFQEAAMKVLLASLWF